MKVVKLSSLSTSRLYSPGNTAGTFCYRLSRRQRLSAVGRSQWNTPMTPSGIEAATFRLVVPEPPTPPRATFTAQNNIIFFYQKFKLVLTWNNQEVINNTPIINQYQPTFLSYSKKVWFIISVRVRVRACVVHVCTKLFFLTKWTIVNDSWYGGYANGSHCNLLITITYSLQRTTTWGGNDISRAWQKNGEGERETFEKPEIFVDCTTARRLHPKDSTTVTNTTFH